MKFATIMDGDAQRFGLVEGDGIHLAPAGDRLRDHLDGDLAALAERLRRTAARPLADVSWAPVVPDPAQILCVGLNYMDHREETGASMPAASQEHPVIFTRFATTLAAHGEALPIPSVAEIVDYEAELAVIIGRGGRYIDTADAMDHVAGYAPFNDISMRDWQTRASQWAPGKNFPRSGPLGPVMVTPDEVGDLGAAGIRLTLDGTVMQESWLRYLIFDIPTLISYISNFVELRPGDVIATGTPGGVGFVRKPPVLLAPGKTCVVEIDGVGRLENSFYAE